MNAQALGIAPVRARGLRSDLLISFRFASCHGHRVEVGVENESTFNVNNPILNIPVS
jgi:hypothetical protein